VWNAETLKEFQERKEYVQGKAAEYLQDRDDELQKMHETSNLFAKAMHYRNAAAAVEKYSLQPVRSMSQVPSATETIQIDDDLFLTRTGTVWNKHMHYGKTFLGAAVISPQSFKKQDDDNDESAPPKPSWSADALAP